MSKVKYNWDITTNYSTLMGKYKTMIEKSFIDYHLGTSQGKKILDIGGGSGRFAIPLSKYHEVTVVDKSDIAISILDKRDTLNKIRKINSEFRKELFNNEKFDVVLMIEIFPYIKNVTNLLDEVYDLLTDDGIFIFTIMNKSSYKYFMRKLKKSSTKYPNVKKYIEYKKLCRNKSFTIKDEFGYNWAPLKVNSNSKWIYFFIEVERLFKLSRLTYFSPEVIFLCKKGS